MQRLFSIALVLLSMTACLLAAPIEQAAPSPSLRNVEAAIQSELEVHGDRVLGKDIYHWSSRLERIEGCRAMFSVRITNNLAGSTVQVESVSLSLGGLDTYSIELQQHWLQLPCLERQNCVESTTTCTQRTKEGLVINCTTPIQKRAEAFSLQLDGDAASAARLQQDLRDAASACREPRRVSF